MNDFSDVAGFASRIGRTRIAGHEEAQLFQQVAIFLADGRVVAGETFRLVRLEGQEDINTPFEFKLELHANTADGTRAPEFGFEDLLSRPVTVGIELPAAGLTPEQAGERFARALKGGAEDSLCLWNGIVAEFSMGLPGVYHLTMRPTYWTLGLTNRYQVHRQLSIRGLIESVLRDHGMRVEGGDAAPGNSVDVSAISGADNPAVTRVQDWLQAGESDLEFLTRIAAHARVYYYFEHHATRHRIVFANRPAFSDALPDGRKLRYADTATEPLGLEQDDLVLDYRYRQSMTASGVDGFLVRQSAAWEQDEVAGFQTYHASEPVQIGKLPFRRLQVMQYGGSEVEARWDALTSNAARATAAVSLSGSSTCARLRAGNCFQLDDAGVEHTKPRAIRPTLAGKRLVVTKVSHASSLDGHYRNQFEATAADGQVGGFALSDAQQGTLLAQVVRHDNGEYPQDWRYYQSNVFDPEQDRLRDTTANPPLLRAKGVYVRFATDAPDADPTWIKLSASMSTVPELGVTVLVARAQDTSELPEIQNLVEAGGRLVVKPSGWAASTNVGSNYSTNYGDGCAVHFGRDSLADLVTARNWVEDKYRYGNARQSGWFAGVHLRDVSWSQGGSSSYSQAEHGREDVLSESVSIGSTYSVQDGKESKSLSTLDYSYSEQTHGSSDSYSTVLGRSYSENKVADQVSKNNIGNEDSTSNIVKQTTHSNIGQQFSYSGVGAETSFSGVGARTTFSGVAAQTSISSTGVETSLSTTAMQTSISRVGVSTNLHGVGVGINVSVTGSALEVTSYGSGVRVDNSGDVLDSKLTGLQAQIVSILKVIL